MTKTRRQGEGETRRSEAVDPCDRTSPSLLDFLSPCLMIALVVYAVLMSFIVWSLMSARNWALAELATPRSTQQWQEWREDVREQQSDPGPVRRRVPRSMEPPALVLMRDYFGVSLIGAVLFTTVLYWVIAWFVMGMLQPTDGLNRETVIDER
jgi:hypothetical protein